MNATPPSNQRLRPRVRLVVSGFLEILTLVVCAIPTWDYGVYDRTKFWYAFSNFFVEFAVAFLPTVAILFLFPILRWGSHSQKFSAAILLMPAAWFGFMGWEGVVERFMDFYRYGS